METVGGNLYVDKAEEIRLEPAAIRLTAVVALAWPCRSASWRRRPERLPRSAG